MTNPVDRQVGADWKDPGIPAVRPRQFEVRGTREEISLLFLNQASATGNRDSNSPTTDCIILNPGFAKRLAISLGKCIRDYELEYGQIQSSFKTVPANRSLPKISAKKTRADTEIDRFLEQVRALGVDTAFEHSFKMLKGTLLSNRFLVGLDKHDLGQNAPEKVLEICEAMAMPDDFLSAFQNQLPEANYIHFGFEDDGKATISKAYLEFYTQIEKGIKKGVNRNDGPFLLYRGFKWNRQDRGARFETRYHWHPWITVSEMVDRIAVILDPSENASVFGIIQSILSLAAQRMPQQDMLYLEVTEKGNPRKSFDVNLYGAGLELVELYPYLIELYRHYSFDPDLFETIYQSSKTQIFGHLSGGKSRDEADFLTIYHGVKDMWDQRCAENHSETTSGDEAPEKIPSPANINPRYKGVEEKEEKVALLFDLLYRLGAPVGLERSFKVSQRTLVTDRLLMGFRRQDVAGNPQDPILNICRRINMPEEFMNTFEKYLPSSNIVLFGFEGSKEMKLFKAYLEFGDRLAVALSKNPENPQPFPIHMAFKWNASDNSVKNTADYICFPAFTATDILKRISTQYYPGPPNSHAFKIVERIIGLATERISPEDFIYFEAKESNNPRSSFDINLYTADLRMNELYPLLMDMARHYAIPQKSFHDLYRSIRPFIFGHITGGMDRSGDDFLTVYFAEKGSSSMAGRKP